MSASDPQMLIFGGDDRRPKPRGRPKAEEPRIPASMRLPVAHYDHVARLAIREGQSVAKTLEDIVITHLRRKR